MKIITITVISKRRPTARRVDGAAAACTQFILKLIRSRRTLITNEQLDLVRSFPSRRETRLYLPAEVPCIIIIRPRRAANDVAPLHNPNRSVVVSLLSQVLLVQCSCSGGGTVSKPTPTDRRTLPPHRRRKSTPDEHDDRITHRTRSSRPHYDTHFITLLLPRYIRRRGGGKLSRSYG